MPLSSAVTSRERRKAVAITIRKATVYLVEDHPFVCGAMTALIHQEPDLVVCGQSGDARVALEEIKRLAPDLITVDIMLGCGNGIDLLKDILTMLPQALVLVVSAEDEFLYAERVIRAGAKGYLMKAESIEELALAIRQILNGGIYISQGLRQRLFPRRHASKRVLPKLGELSDRELQVLQLMGHGIGPSKIAEKLSVSVKSIEYYQSRLKSKLHLPHGDDLWQYASRLLRGS
jgi:DNA-binding NarL/FixJ family response regulator